MVSKFIRGVCTVATECQLSMEALTRGRPHGLGRCGFTDEPVPDEIVCCPTTAIMPPEKLKKFKKPVTKEKLPIKETDIRGTTKRKCQKCKFF